MAEAPTLTFVLEAQDRVTAQLQKVEQSLNNLNNKVEKTNQGTDKLSKSNDILTGSYVSLGKALALIGGTAAVTSFLKTSTEAANEDSKALILLVARLKSVGIEYGSARGKIEEYTDKMIKLGVAESDLNDGLGKLVTKTKDTDTAMKMSSMAADLAASGYGTYADNIDNFIKILSGRGARAMKAYNIKMDENATTAEQLNAVQEKVTISAAQMAETTVGKLAVMNTNWAEFKGNLGKIGMFFEDQMATAVNNFFDNTSLASGNWVEYITKVIYSGANFLAKTPEILMTAFEGTVEGIFDTVFLNPLTKLKDATDNFWNKLFGLEANASSKMSENSGWNKLDKIVNDLVGKTDDVDKFFEKLNTPLQSGSALNKGIDWTSQNIEDLSGSAEKAAEKMSDAFVSFSKNVLSEVDKQKDAIASLRESMMSETEKYNAEIERIEKDTGLMGVENSAAKEAALASAANDYGRKVSAYQSNETDAKRQLLLTAIKASDPNLMQEISKESGSFLYEIGQSAVQQQFTFNFNGDVNDIDRLKDLIISAFNRQAELVKVK